MIGGFYIIDYIIIPHVYTSVHCVIRDRYIPILLKNVCLSLDMCSVRNRVVSVCILQSVVNFFQLQMMCLVCIQLRRKGRLIFSLRVVTSVPGSYHDCFCFIELRSSSEMGEPAAGLISL